jgi:hypothetical protein
LVIVVPFAGEVHPRTRVSLAGYGVTYVDVGGHPSAYPLMLGRMWHADTIIVEHDVVVPAGAIEGLEECPNPWCYHSYIDYPGGLWPPMGLCRVRAEAMTATPECWTRYLARRAPGLNPDTMRPMPPDWHETWEEGLPPALAGEKPWSHCDEWLAAYLRKHGIDAHRHFPDVENL